MRSNYKVIDHTADLGIRIYGNSLKNLFENAGYALMDLMVKAGSTEKAVFSKIRISGDDICDLMVRWLGELLYLLEGEKSLVFSIHIDSISHTQLEATMETIPFDPQSHEILTEIKAVTYHQIEVTDNGYQWEAQVIFDL
ncbi:MAG: archease [Pseudomonadota bacterium]